VVQKIAQFQGLFDLLKKHLNVPSPAVKIARRVRTLAQIVGDQDHQSVFAFDFDMRFHASQQHAFVLRIVEDKERVLDGAFDTFGEGLFHRAGHVFFGTAHPPYLPLIQIVGVLQIDVGLVKNNDFTGGDACTDFARPPVIVMGSGVDQGKGGKNAVAVEAQVHFGGRLASAVFGLTDAVDEVLLYDLTSTYFESPPPENAEDIRRLGYSRDKRSDCVHVVIALIVTLEGFPMAYEVLVGNTAANSTLGGFLQKIHSQYGKTDRLRVMDRGIPTEEIVAQMHESNPPVSYLVGAPKGCLSQLEESLLRQPWRTARASVRVKLLAAQAKAYVLAESEARIGKERSMRQRRVRKYLKTLAEIKGRKKR
jgi:hypothetical protein